jgi:poly(3-hydroxybutyrate) depolymerase
MSQTSAGAPASQPRIADRHHVGGRSWDLIIQSPAVGNQVPVRILLPAQYEQRPQQRWPVLYLLHGCCDSYLSWTRSTDIEELSANLKALVVMPDGGEVGSTPTGLTARNGRSSTPKNCRSFWRLNTAPTRGLRSPGCPWAASAR